MPVTHTSQSIDRLQREAIAYGCPELITLVGPETDTHLNYLDLMQSSSTTTLLPDAVVEFQGRPLLYLIDDLQRSPASDVIDEKAQDLSQLLANRSEHALLGIVRPGELTLYPINLDRTILSNTHPVIVSVTEPEAPLFFQKLATGSFSLEGQAETPDYVFDEIHRLLASADTELAGTLAPLEVLSITGRALFFRFLHDRRIVMPQELADICPPAYDLKDVFTDAARAAATSCWLDDTFNGDFLPLIDCLDSAPSRTNRMEAYTRFFYDADTATSGAIFRHLEAIMRGWKHIGGSSFQMTIDWDDFDFAHIPIGVLSQIYETFSRRWDAVRAEEASVRYTPTNIARLAVEEALSGVEDGQNARVLDPACGAGVFLVLAFREIVRLHWRQSGKRPEKKIIHDILYNQIWGFDISESALRLAALALYITAIEVNGTTRPPKTLKFPRALKGEVLYDFSPRYEDERRYGFVLGSLGPHVPEHFDNKFDVVVGNPPWTRLRAKPQEGANRHQQSARDASINRQFTKIARRALTARHIESFDAKAYKNPDNNPDLPFLWRATEWAKPGGVVAFVLPSRIVLKQSAPGQLAREALLRGLSVTGILNCSDLEKTAVWPNMHLPFMLFFARNEASPPHHKFAFVTPIREKALSKRAAFRLDYRSAQVVSVDVAVTKPWIFKTLSVGSALDVEVIDKISSRNFPTIADVWADLPSGEGYNVSPGLPQRSADYLLELPDFVPPAHGFEIDISLLESWGDHYGRDTANRPRDASLYEPPLVIVPQTPGETRDRPKAYLSEKHAIAFSKSYYGYSTAGHDNPLGLANLLHLLVHSQLWHHHYLTHSSRIGASYRTFLKEDLDKFFLPDPNTVTRSQWQRINTLSAELRDRRHKPWDKVDNLVFELYHLSPHDVAIISDTVRFGTPFQSARLPAEQPPERADVDAFCQYLEDMVQPFVKGLNAVLCAREIGIHNGRWNLPWRFVSLTRDDEPVEVSSAFLSTVMQEANRTAASRVVMILPEGGLFIGLLNQLRFWSESRARMCSVHIIRQHLSALRP